MDSMGHTNKVQEIAEIDDFIGVFDNAVTDEYCDSIIDFFERQQNIGKVVSRQEAEKISPNWKKDSMYFYRNERDPLIVTQQASQLSPFVETIHNCYGLYVEKYGIIQDLGRHSLNSDIKLQKTLPGEGYHIWHSEVTDIPSSRRLLFCMLYLNDVDEGGETEFLYQHRRIKPVKGRIVLCPTGFTHTHRGNPPLSTAKYIITGWIEFISFGTDRPIIRKEK